ncbi:MAG: BamA/TamA family outer membrane protein [Bdellovibrionales bacterium]|nr:BamA/TamA family outer membrane protein [Bdellovibrionales bacterium]
MSARASHIFILSIFTALIFSWSAPSFAQFRLKVSDNPIIENMTKEYRGRSISLSEIDHLVRELSQSGLFQVVYAEKLDNNEVVIRGQATLLIKKITVRGNTSFAKDEIIDTMNLPVGKKASYLDIKIAVDNIKSLYAESGFYNFDIQTERKPVDDGVELVVNISEEDFCIIEDIRIFSKNKDLNEHLKILLAPHRLQSFKKNSISEISKEIETYLLDNRYLTARISETSNVFNPSKTRVKISYSISNPIQFEFIFHGSNYFSHFDLIKESQIGGKFLYLSDSSGEIVENIRQLYIRNGFPEVKIEFSETHFPDLNKKVLVFKIDEGRRVKIGDIKIIGKISRPRGYYLNLLKDRLAKADHLVYFVREEFNSATEKMMDTLKRDGFLQAQLLSLDVTLSKEGYANVTLQIDEGILTYVRQVLFRGAKSFNNMELRKVTEIEANKPLHLDTIEESFEKLEIFYQEKGYLEFHIKNKNASVIKYRAGQPYADVVFQIEEGPKIKVNSIAVKGNTKTKNYVIIRELEFKEGDTLTLSKVNNSIERLEKSGLFSKVYIRSLEQGSEAAERTILVEIEERRPGLFVAGTGLLSQGNLTYRGYLGVLYNNLGGHARGISSRVDLQYQENRAVNYLENRAAIAYYEPFLTQNRVRGRVSLVRAEEVFNISQDGEKSTIISKNEVLFSTEKEFSKKLRFTYNVWGFSNQTTFLNRNKNDRKTINIATTGPIVEYDRRNDQFLPTQGSYSRFDLEYSDPFIGSSRDNPSVNGFFLDKNKEVNYYRGTLSHSFYVPMSRSQRWVWATSVRGGYLRNISSREDSGVPASKSFSLGGSSTLRGYSTGASESFPGTRELCIKGGLINLGDPTSACSIDEFFVRSNSSYFLVKTEIRFPIRGNLGGHLFYDGAGVYFGDFKLEDPYRDSTGFGIRYQTPVGSFTAEVGYKLDRKLGGPTTYYDKESDIAFHLAIRAGL